MKQSVKVLFASASEALIPGAIEHMRALLPELPLIVVSEFPPTEECRWIPYPIRRNFRENLALCRFTLGQENVRLAAVILQPQTPHWQMRAVAFAIAPWRFLAFNEHFGHFMLRPRSLPVIAKHLLWRMRNWVRWKIAIARRPWTLRWQLLAALAQAAGSVTALLKANRSSSPHPAAIPPLLPHGVSVVIPSRNGKDLLVSGLPEIVDQIAAFKGEIIVSDNGSDDGTAQWLKSQYPQIVVLVSSPPLSFARAVNAGIAAARFSHLLLLNNDMVIEPRFLAALRGAFDQVPDLFCATAQIFFPAGVRREETGKAVMPSAGLGQATDFPLSCELPIEGENLSYVLYGSGGCSMFDTAKLRALHCLDPIYEPAYVEDLDLGVRGWQHGWASVFVAAARVLHQHRATTSRYYSPEQLDSILELNYLRFLARTVRDSGVFLRLWRQNVRRLKLLANGPALKQACRAPAWVQSASLAALSDDRIFALGSGEICVFPGKPKSGKPIVIIATPYLPFPLAHGGAVRMFNLMCRAAGAFDQVLVSFVDELNPVPPELLRICVEVVTVRRIGSHARPSSARPAVVEEFDSPAYHAALRQMVQKWSPSIVQLEFTQMAQYAVDCRGAKTLLVEHDITLDLHRQWLAQVEDWELRYQLERWIPFETAAWKQVDCVVTMSEKDRRLITNGQAAVLRNGVDVDQFFPATQAPEQGRLLFIGSFGHLPNLGAIYFLLTEVWRLLPPGLTLHIIGGVRHKYFLQHHRSRVRLDLNQPGVEVEGFVSDVRPAYRRATLVVAPLLVSAGTNIKILEAMAMGKAIVTTSAGLNGLDVTPGEDVIVANGARQMADEILSLLGDVTRRKRLERRARQTAVSQFDWNRTAAVQTDLYRSLIQAPAVSCHH